MYKEMIVTGEGRYDELELTLVVPIIPRGINLY
jgi:hypothetical protein